MEGVAAHAVEAVLRIPVELSRPAAQPEDTGDTKLCCMLLSAVPWSGLLSLVWDGVLFLLVAILGFDRISRRD